MFVPALDSWGYYDGERAGAAHHPMCVTGSTGSIYGDEGSRRNSVFHRRISAPLLSPQSAVIRIRLAS